MRSRRTIWVLLCLLCLAGAWFFWQQDHHVAAAKKSADRPAALKVRAASTAPKFLTKPAVTAKAAATGTAVTNQFAYRLSNTSKSIGELVRDDKAILLANALIDLRNPLNFSIPKNLQAQGDPGAYIVQANGPIDGAFRAMLAAAGATIVSYIPNDAYLVRASASVANGIANNGFSVIPYEPYYKVQSSLLPFDEKPLPGGTVVNLGLFSGNAQPTIQQIEKLGGQVLAQDSSPFGPIVRVLPPMNNWTALAQLPGVQIVEPYRQRVHANDLSRATVGVSTDSTNAAYYTNGIALTGKNVTVEVNDSGIDATHPDLTGRVFGNPADFTDTDGHGTHVAGIIAGDGTESTTVTNAQGSINPGVAGQYRGMAPMADLFIEDLNNSDATLQETPALTNALISNNSWIYDGNSTYDLAAASYDAATRDALPAVTGSQPVLFVFAAGNDGNGDDASDPGGGMKDTIQSPATAKDVITVGAIQEERNITNEVTNADGTVSATWQPETSTSYRVAGFSSRGDVGIGTEGTYGRFKPDVVAPGTFIVSTRSSQWDIGTYFYQDPTNFDVQEFDNIIVQPDSIWPNGFPEVPNSTIQATIEVEPNANSPDPFPSMPIYVGLLSSAGYDFNTTNNEVLIPPDGGANYLNEILNSQSFGVGFNYGISNTTSEPISFDLITDVITTNNPGNYFLVLSNLDNSLGGPPYYYRYESGTSMAAADVSGVLALMQGFFTNQWNTQPSPALLKAMLINGARVTDSAFYNFQAQNMINYEGWGLINLPDSVPPGITTNGTASNVSMFVQDQSPTNALATGDSQTFNVVLNTNALAQPLRVTLAWTDPPGNPAAATKLVNDLNLVVTNSDDPANPIVYYGNDIPASSTFNSARSTNAPPNYDSINNVENVYLPAGLGTNFSVTVMGYRVNVNAVTAQTNNSTGAFAPNVVQDYALVISSGDGAVTNAMTVKPGPIISSPTTGQQITGVTNSNGGVLLNQTVGANSPLLGTNTILFNGTAPEDLGTNWQITLGMTNQWHFYVVTNPPANSGDFTNAAFVTFNPATLSIPREGVFADSQADATRPEADIDLYVAGPNDPDAASLTNLNPTVISNCVYGLNGDGASLGRGGTEFVAYSNSAPNNVYYIGVKSEDQMASEYGFLSVFTTNPFSLLNNGVETVNGLLLPLNIPDGSPAHPGVGLIFALAIYPIDVGSVVVSDTITHQNFGDLIGTLNHNDISDVLNNHDSLGDPPGPYSFVYDDSGANANPGSQLSDGPGSLNNFIGTEGIGPWLLTEVDDSQTQTGFVSNFQLTIQPHQTDDDSHTNTVQGLGWFYDFIDVPPGATNLTITVTNMTGTANPPLELFVKYGALPTTNDFDEMVLITNTTIIPPELQGSISIGAPLTSGRYYYGVYNPSATPQEIISFATFGVGFVPAPFDFSSSGSATILDDAVTTNSIFVSPGGIISSVNVGLAVNDPRISDLVFHLISPDGTRVLLMENRGGTSTNGAGTTTTTTNITAVSLDIEELPATNYSAGPIADGWSVISNQVSVVNDSSTYTNGNFLALANGTISSILPTVAGQTYTLSFAYRGPGIVGWWRGESNANDSINANTGTFLGAGAAYTNGEVGTAMLFNGVDNGVRVPNSANLNVGVGNGLTLEAWVKPISTSPFAFSPVMEWNDGSGINYGVQLGLAVPSFGTGNFFANLVDTGGHTDWHVIQSSPGVIVTNVYQHIAVTYDKISGNSVLYYNGTPVTNANLGPFTPQTSLPYLYIGERPPGDANSGVIDGPIDEASIYNRALSASEIHAIYSDGTAGKFDTNEFTTVSPSLSLAEAEVSIAGVATNLFGDNTNWQTATITFTATNNETPLQITGLEPGMLLTAMSLTNTQINTQYQYLTFTEDTNLTTTPIKFAVPPFVSTTNSNLYYLPEQSLDAYAGENALGEWMLEIQDDRAGAGLTNTLESWQLQFTYTTATSSLTNGESATNSLQPGGIAYYLVNVPTNADFATNSLFTSSGPLNFWFNAATLPSGTNSDDHLLFNTSANESTVLSTISAPTNIVPGGTYYLAVQNTNTFAVTNFAVEVDFHLLTVTNLIGGQPQTNTVAPDSFAYYAVTVPTNADIATNILISATGPVNLLFNQTTLPTGLGAGDFTLLPASTGGSTNLTLAGSPPLVPGQTYYLGVQNTNSTAVTFGVEVDFHLLVATNPPIIISSIIQTNIGGTNGFWLTWFAPSNDLFQVQWTDDLAPPIAWNTFTNIVSYNTNVFTSATNTQFNFFDDGSQTGGFGPLRFYRLILLGSGLTNGAPETNSIPAGGITYYSISVPTNADFSTNSLFMTNGPLNLWFNQSVPPTGTNASDYLLFSASTNDSAILGTNSPPPFFVPGGFYYLGVQNTNSFAVNYSIEVDFHLFTVTNAPTNAVSISSITYTNVGGTNAVLLQWVAPTNYQFQIQWTTNLAAPIAWDTISNIVLTWTGIPSPTNPADGIYEFLDDGSLTGGFGPLKFYRLIEYPYSTPIPLALSIANAQFTTNGIQFQWSAPTNYQYEIQWTTNLALPLSNWSVLANPVLSVTNGVFTFTDTNQTGPSTSTKFFRLLAAP